MRFSHKTSEDEGFIAKAKLFASMKHEGQLDDDGETSYFFAHLDIVGHLVASVTDDKEVIAAAYLHDTLEDTKTTKEELVEVFGQRVADLVHEMTHEGQKDNYGYYFPRLKTREGMLIKFADRLSNLSRMSLWPEERQAQYLKRSKFWKDGSDK